MSKNTSRHQKHSSRKPVSTAVSSKKTIINDTVVAVMGLVLVALGAAFVFKAYEYEKGAPERELSFVVKHMTQPYCRSQLAMVGEVGTKVTRCWKTLQTSYKEEMVDKSL